MRKHKNVMVALAFLTVASILLAACQPQTVIQTVEVTKEVQVPVVQTQVVVETQVQEAPAFSKPHPILGDLRNRQGIAYCTNRDELIASVYPFIEDKTVLNMNTFIPRNSWANYDGDELVKYPFDAAKGGQLFTDAGWTLAEGATFRQNANGDEMSLHFTTTSAAFRQTWAAVFEAQMKACGLRVIRLHAPAAWWFGDTTGISRRDYELGAFAWVGQSDPGGQTLYACDQIPLPTNGWVGQNAMGWCNQVASDNIKLANNTLDRAQRIEAYKQVQIEFTKDMVSLPLFNRASVEAANVNLKNFKSNTTDYYTWNSYEWELPGTDTVVLAYSQEPASMYSLVESAAVERSIGNLIYDEAYSTLDYDYQSVLFSLSTLESGLAKNNDVDVKEGDPVLSSVGDTKDKDGNLLTLTKGLKVKNSQGEEVTFDSGTVNMKQLVVTYQFKDGIKWSDGEPVVKADFELAYKNDCDPASGATSFTTCESIQSVDFTSDTEFTVTYKPGYQAPLYFVSPIGLYPSHQKLASGGTLADAPAADWATLPEIAECPLGVGPYTLACGDWEKGVKMTLHANPNYWRGADALKIKTVVVTFVADTNSAVAQLLTGDVDVVGSETLGAGQEVQTVIDAQKKDGKVQVVIAPSATWEHIDMNLNLP